MFQTVEEVRIKAGQGIAGHVAQSGVLVNIRDAYTHPLFYRDVDKHTGFRTRYIVTYRDDHNYYLQDSLENIFLN